MAYIYKQGNTRLVLRILKKKEHSFNHTNTKKKASVENLVEEGSKSVAGKKNVNLLETLMS